MRRGHRRPSRGAGIPTANAIAAVNAVLHARIAVSAMTLAVSTELRGIGSERSRSMNPCSRSSAIADALPIPENRTPVAMKPGDEVIDVAHAGDVDRAAEHVAVDQEEQGHLDRGEHDQLGCAHVAQERATSHRHGALREPRVPAALRRRALVDYESIVVMEIVCLSRLGRVGGGVPLASV